MGLALRIVLAVAFIGMGIAHFLPTVIAAVISLIVFLIAVFPANIYAAAHKERFGRAAFPLVPRAIGQIVLIALLVVAAILY